MNATNPNSTLKIITAHAVMEGAGVKVYRTLGTSALRHLDPFLMLDNFSTDNPDDYIAGFPSHPHRGFNTFTYMVEGHMEHKDSMGNTGNLESGGAQWMKAGSGVIHSEMPKQEAGLMRGFQLWINLPAANKMDAPEYQEYPSEAFPVIENDAYRAKVVIGRFEEATSPIIDEITDVSYVDIDVKAGESFSYQLPKAHNSFLYLFEGNGQLADQALNTHTLVALDFDHAHATFVAGEQGARFLLVSGKPINEPIEQYGPFVMNTKAEINQAMTDFQSNTFVKDKAWMNRERVPTS